MDKAYFDVFMTGEEGREEKDSLKKDKGTHLFFPFIQEPTSGHATLFSLKSLPGLS